MSRCHPPPVPGTGTTQSPAYRCCCELRTSPNRPHTSTPWTPRDFARHRPGTHTPLFLGPALRKVFCPCQGLLGGRRREACLLEPNLNVQRAWESCVPPRPPPPPREDGSCWFVTRGPALPPSAQRPSAATPGLVSPQPSGRIVAALGPPFVGEMIGTAGTGSRFQGPCLCVREKNSAAAASPHLGRSTRIRPRPAPSTGSSNHRAPTRCLICLCHGRTLGSSFALRILGLTGRSTS